MVLMTLKTLQSLTDDYEVVVVNDGSTDYTDEVLQELEKRFDNVRIVRHEKNRGYGATLISGFAHCSKDLIFYTDGDAQYDAREMVFLVQKITDDVDWVNGYKISRSDPLHRKIIGRMYHWFVYVTFGIRLRDVDCDFRLIRRAVFDRVQLRSDSGVICVEMIKKFQMHGLRVAEVPVHHYFRAYGKSQFFNFPRLFRVGIQLAQLWWRLVVRGKKD